VSPKSLQSDEPPVAEQIMAAENEERHAIYAHFADQMIAAHGGARLMTRPAARLTLAWLIESLR
jgi:hypothetical protein